MTEHRKANQCIMRWENRISCNEIAGHLGVHVNCRIGLRWWGQVLFPPTPGSFAANDTDKLPEPAVLPFSPPWAREADEPYLRHVHQCQEGSGR